MNITLTLASRYLGGRKLRTFLTTLAVVFGVLVLFGMNILLPSMLNALQANALAAEGQVDVTITHISGNSFDASLFDKIKSLDGVRAASASLNRTVNLPPNFYDKDPAKTDRVSALALVGVDPEAARTVRSYPTLYGRYLKADDGASTVISQSLADALSVKVGDSFPIPTANGTINLTVAGILPPRAMPGNEEVLVTLKQAQEMALQPGLINAIDLNLNTTDEARRKAIVANIESVLGKDFQVGSISAGSEMVASLRLGQQMFDLFGLLALFMGAFIIFNTFRTIVVERRRDIGMLRALGANRSTILGLILVEGLLQGIIGTAVGLALGYLLGAGILKVASPLMSQYVNIKLGGPVVSAPIVIISILLGVGVTVLAGLIPALNASKVMPLEAIRPSVAEVEYKRQMGRGFFVGLALLGASLLLIFSKQAALVGPGGLLFLVSLVMVAPALVRPLALAFGWLIGLFYARSGTGALAQGNLSRQPSRVAITASATMLGLAIIVATGGLVSSLTITMSDVIKKSLGSDYLFIPPSIALWNSDVGSNASFAGRLRSINGVGDVSTLRFAGSTVKGQNVSLLGIQPDVFQRVSGLRFMENILPNEAAAYQALAGGRALIANGAFMTLAGVNVGDTVQLATPNGQQAYRIVAVGADLLNVKVTTAYISQANLQADFNKTEDIFIQLNLKPGANAQAVDKEIHSVAADFPQYNIISGRAYYDTMMGQINAVFVGMYLLLAMLALPSLIAMLNTLAIGVIERTREIGMIRAVGSTQRQIHAMVLAEALILAGIGATFGILGGIYLSYLFVIAFSPIFPLGFAFPTAGIVTSIIVGLVFGALAAIIPARQAARLEIVRALRYE